MDDSTTTTGATETPFDGFTQLADALRDAVTKFQDDQTPENFATIITALSGFGLSSVEVWRKAAEYTRRHPFQVAALAGLTFFALKGLTASSRREPQSQLPESAIHH